MDGRSGVRTVRLSATACGRCAARESNRIARVILCMGDGHVILLHGFIKKTQKVPQADIDLALKRKREVT